jgi:hypothetical protein
MDRDERIWWVKRWLAEGRFLRDGPMGMTAQWDSEDGAKLRDWRRSLIDDRYNGQLRDPGLPQEHTFDVPVLRKRTAEERLESMIRRLKDAHPVQQAALLQEIGGEYWRAGMPVTQDALRKAATDILNKADKRVALSNATAGGK